MRKKILCMLVIISTLMQFGLYAGAYTAPAYQDKVDVFANMQVQDASHLYQDDAIAVKTTDVGLTNGDNKFDFVCKLKMSPVRKKFLKYMETSREIISYESDDATRAALSDALDNMKITGEFTINILVPKDLEFTPDFLSNGVMYGFSDATKKIFGNDTRTITDAGDNNKVSITVKVTGEDNSGYVLAKNLENKIEEYLPDLELECTGTVPKNYGLFTVVGEMSGKTKATSSNPAIPTIDVDYKASQNEEGANPKMPGKISASYILYEIGVDSDVKVKDDSHTYQDSSITYVKNLSSDFPSVDFKGTFGMDSIRNKYLDSMSAFSASELDNTKIKSEFEVEILYPSDLELPAAFVTGGDMYGFSNEAKAMYEEIGRTVTPVNSKINKMVISLKILGEDTGVINPGYVKGSDFKNNPEKYLPDLTFECIGAKPQEYGTYTFIADIFGKTTVESDKPELDGMKITYKGVQKPGEEDNVSPKTISASYIVKQRTGGSSSSGGSSTVETKVKLSFDIDGDMGSSGFEPIVGEKGMVVDLTSVSAPHKEGYKFNGWYLDKKLTKKSGDSITVNNDTVIYAGWKKIESASMLNADEHFAYIIGYPDGNVRPEDNITREEVATIFFRLLKDDIRNQYMTRENSFNDVSADRWSNTAISTAEKANLVVGFDGSFKPEDYITRAEFATIASRLDETNEDVKFAMFDDVKGHWAEKYIEKAMSKGWIFGDDNKTFRPDSYITRAEVMAIVNRMLVRYTNKEGIKDNAVFWPDNKEDAWYYYAVEEATNSHDFERAENEIYEKWTEVKENKDWAKIELPKE